MAYWLMKTEPETFSWAQLVKDGKTIWDGVRNYQARNFMQQMKKGDYVLIYHSVSDKCVVGIARVSKPFFPDPTSADTRWVAVEIVPEKPFNIRVTLEEIKNTPKLAQMALLKQSRLSVMPLSKEEYTILCKMGRA